MSSQSPHLPHERFAQALAAGGATIQRALEKLLSPAAVTALPVRRLEAHPFDRVVLVRFRIDDRPSAQLLVVANEASSALLASALHRRHIDDLDDDALRALTELANIVASSFLNGLSHSARLRLLPTIPQVETLDPDTTRAAFAALGSHAYEAPFEATLGQGCARLLFVAAADDATVEELMTLLVSGRSRSA